jgi:curved DNA-binding protein CbpA
MNVFERAVAEGRIGSEEELKRLFWKLAKRLHPDSSGVEGNQDKFIRLKGDYDLALERLRAGAAPRPAAPPKAEGRGEASPYERKLCEGIFVDLMASAFPVDRSIRAGKAYLSRINRLNVELSKLGPRYRDLFLRFEGELYELRGESTILNHDYSLVMLYLYRFSAYASNGYGITKNYLRNGYRALRGLFEARGMAASELFLDWLVADIPNMPH